MTCDDAAKVFVCAGQRGPKLQGLAMETDIEVQNFSRFTLAGITANGSESYFPET
jgi:hypothetical protein